MIQPGLVSTGASDASSEDTSEDYTAPTAEPTTFSATPSTDSGNGAPGDMDPVTIGLALAAAYLGYRGLSA